MGRNVVLYVDSMIMPDKNAAAQRATAICMSFIELGKKTVVVGLDDDISANTSILNTLEVYKKIDCYAVKSPKTAKEWINRMVTIKPFVTIMKNYGLENIHSLIVMDYQVIALYKLKKFCIKHNINLIADSVEWYDKSKKTFPVNIIKNLDTKLRMKFVYPKIDNMICISKYLYNYYKGSVRNIVEIPGTIDPQDKKWTNLPKYNPSNILTIGYAGNPGLDCSKERVDWLIKAVCELNIEGKPCKLIMAGFNESLIENLEPEITKLPYYQTNIIYLGEILHSNCISMIASCDFSAIVREDKIVTRAGFPTKLSESFACSTPVITTPSGNISDYLINGKNGFLTDGFSYTALKKVIDKATMLTISEKIKMHKHLKNELVYKNFTNELNEFL